MLSEKNTSPDRASRAKANASAGGRFRNRKGSFLVESAVVVPAFIIAAMMLISIIPVIADCESVAYSAAEELRLEMIRSAAGGRGAALPAAVQIRAAADNRNAADLRITRYRHRYTDKNIDDLIQIRFRTGFQMKNPLGMYSGIRFSGVLTGRAYTGTYYKGGTGEEDTRKVCIFPDRGNCYHNDTCTQCTHVRAACRQQYLTPEIQRRYRPCPNCDAKHAKTGTPVFVFQSYGDAYHTGGCRSVKRYYRVVTASEAKRDGYRACSKCGGGLD